MSEVKDYPLGYSAEEAQRLEQQAATIEELTEDLLLRAGLRRGMHVLDIGSGVGEVSLLAARIVGRNGAVLGIEKASSSVETAHRKAADLGLKNVTFEQGDITEFTTDRKFDALVGRFVLLYVLDRITLLQTLAQHLNPGAIVAFQEVDMSQISQTPPSELFIQARRWLLEAFAAGGAELDMGTKLYTTYRQAGLPAPIMIAANPVVGGPACQGYDDLVQGLRSLLPVIEQNGIASAKEIDIDTLTERLRADAAENDRVMYMSRVVGAWTQLT